MKRTLSLVIVMAFILGLTVTCVAQTSDQEDKGMMMGKCMKGEMMGPMHGCGTMCKKMIATSDGGVVVMICNKLYKYDKELNLKKEVEIPMDTEHMKKMMMKMKEMRMMEETTKDVQ